ncbi:hypothetical protein PHMEG_00010527 [Phytophthora megakarya]|uniref:Uncharacterized protein n=1 Tax=Phytophthora megakarya TaxID=4795 RepID=A0A225WDG0_9STRA|nr:hypothetical protein PHMEG_00010527 [Phytophthora megakarya]
MDGVVENGHLTIVKWLRENRSEGCTKAVIDKAARNGHLTVVKWLHEYRVEGYNGQGRCIWIFNYRKVAPFESYRRVLP